MIDRRGATSVATVLLAVHNGFAARYLLRSGVLAALREAGADCVILTPNPAEPYFVRQFAADNTLLPLELERCEEQLRARARWPDLERLHLYGTPILTSLWRRRMRQQLTQLRGRTGLYSSAVWCLSAILRRSALARSALRLASRRWLPTGLHGEAFDRYRPDVVVTTSPGYSAWPSDAVLLNEARRRSIPTLAAIYAWDNPSTKGLPLTRPDYALAWSETMHRELALSLDLPPRRIRVTGPAIFDVYAEPEGLPRSELTARFGLGADERMIFFGTMSPFRFPCNLEYVRLVSEAIAAGELPALRLVVRLHPIYHRDGQRRRLRAEKEAWDALARRFPFIAYSMPEVLSDRLPLDMPSGEMAVVAGLVRHADVVVSFFSTLQLEAAIADTPFVSIAFDLDELDATARRPSAFLEHDHNRRTAASGAGVVARDRATLLAGIRRGLETPDLDRAARRRFAEQECGVSDGRAAKRTAEAILDVARRRA